MLDKDMAMEPSTFDRFRLYGRVKALHCLHIAKCLARIF
jgi:hypothetical protein